MTTLPCAAFGCIAFRFSLTDTATLTVRENLAFAKLPKLRLTLHRLMQDLKVMQQISSAGLRVVPRGNGFLLVSRWYES